MVVVFLVLVVLVVEIGDELVVVRSTLTCFRSFTKDFFIRFVAKLYKSVIRKRKREEEISI